MFIFRRLFQTAASPEAMSAAKTKVLKIIDENGVAVFSKSYCVYSNATKRLLDSFGAKYYLLELDQVSDGSEIQDALQEISGQRTVPNIFINHKHIGGNSDIQARKDLRDLLAEAGAI
ncbi:hypothetical protein DL767_001381 [Monosporascus sp. MG133]|nr:hypothetical protein DL767_001381 [Monosporascus sp. MG133]